MRTLTNPIGWCDDTGNMVIGCAKVSPGCLHCYAAVDTPARVLRAGKWPGANGRKVETWGPLAQRWPVKALVEKVRRLGKLCICDTCHETGPVSVLGVTHRYRNPLSLCYGSFRRIRLFADSNSDWLDERWPLATLDELLTWINLTMDVNFLLLTKRPQVFADRLRQVTTAFTGRGADMAALWHPSTPRPWIPNNVWLGVSVEDQQRAEERIPRLLKIPAAVRFLSCEPLLGPVDLAHVCFNGADSFGTLPGIGWVIVGGESGTGARPCRVAWIRDIVRQCERAGVPCYVKQLGANIRTEHNDEEWCPADGKGADMQEWPVDLRVRQFPEGKP